MSTIPYDPTGAALLTPGLRETLFASGRAYSSLQLGAECARLAYLKAESDPTEKKRLEDALARVGFGRPRLFRDEDTGTEGFGALRAADALAVLAFRGTEATTLRDIGTDINVIPERWTEGTGQVHLGFATGLRSVLADVRAWLDGEARERRALLLCGHSLGAALATLAAALFPGAELVTLGSPRVGDDAFVDSLQTVSSTRLVDCCDLVTHLPLHSPWHTHLGPPRYIDRDGALREDASCGAIFEDQLRARIDFALHHALELGSAGARDLADHSPINYLRALF